MGVASISAGGELDAMTATGAKPNNAANICLRFIWRGFYSDLNFVSARRAIGHT